MTEPQAETVRLEQLWEGSFGDEYTERNLGAYAARKSFWDELLAQHACARVLEIGCNCGGNLQWIARHVRPRNVFGVEVNASALRRLHEDLPEVNGVHGTAKELPFRSSWFDLVFTMGVLIHQPDSSLPAVMAEMVRCSRRWVLCGEYFAETVAEVPYRGQEGALFKRDYGAILQQHFPGLRLIERTFRGPDQGWDDMTFWLFEKPVESRSTEDVAPNPMGQARGRTLRDKDHPRD
jgi:pseudaminic acid biosynthesis-associated methylase